MNAKQIGLSVVLAGFSALTAYAVYHHGIVGIFEQALANPAATTLFVDLSISLTLVLAWMWNDARERGASFLPFALVTLVLGSIGPLLYLIRRAGTEERTASRLATATR
jgi:MFS superfamily sulfate permease-like transporter